MCLIQGPVKLEPEPPQFHYFNVEPHTPFFRKGKRNGERVYIMQRGIGDGEPVRDEIIFSANKPENTLRVFIVGESVGIPIADYGFMGKLAEKLLPGKNIEIIPCARAGYDSDLILLLIEELAEYKPDLIVILSGNNEDLVVSMSRSELTLYRVIRFLQRFRLFNYIENAASSLGIEFPRYSFDNEPLNYGEILERFERNLRKMVRESKTAGASVIICSLPYNFRDSAPGGVPPWKDKTFLEAWVHYELKDYAKASTYFKEFILYHPDEPFAHFFLARALEYKEKYLEAVEHYLNAVNLDTLRMSYPLPAIREELQRTVASEEGAAYADIQKAFTKLHPHGLVGTNMLLDKIHMWPSYVSYAEAEILRAAHRYTSYDNGEYILAPAEKWNTEPFDEPLRPHPDTKNNQEKAMTIITNAAFHPIQAGWTKEYIHEPLLHFFESAYEFTTLIFEDVAELSKLLSELYSEFIFSASDYKTRRELEYIISLHSAEMYRRKGLDIESAKIFSDLIQDFPNEAYPYIGRSLARLKLKDAAGSLEDHLTAERLSPLHPQLMLRELFLRESIN